MAHLVDVIQKELLHYDVLACMARSGFLSNLVFQGGTALRLCHGAPCYSEDLEFATAPGFGVEALATFKARIESRMAQRYGLPARLKAPKIRHLETQGAQVAVHRWQLVVNTAPDRPDLPALLGGEGFRATMQAFLDVQAFNETFGFPQFSSHLASVMHELLGQAKAIAFDR